MTILLPIKAAFIFIPAIPKSGIYANKYYIFHIYRQSVILAPAGAALPKLVSLEGSGYLILKGALSLDAIASALFLLHS